MKRPPRHSVLLSECFFHSSLKLQILQAPWQPTSKILLLEERNFLSPVILPSPLLLQHASGALYQVSSLEGRRKGNGKEDCWLEQKWKAVGWAVQKAGDKGIVFPCHERWGLTRESREAESVAKWQVQTKPDSLFMSWDLCLQKLRHTVDLTTILNVITSQASPSFKIQTMRWVLLWLCLSARLRDLCERESILGLQAIISTTIQLCTRDRTSKSSFGIHCWPCFLQTIHVLCQSIFKAW